MAQRTYTVYLRGGASFTLKAARFEQTADGIQFYGPDGEPVRDTYIDPSSVIAVIPPATPEYNPAFPTVRHGS